jgi:hypothetical protein
MMDFRRLLALGLALFAMTLAVNGCGEASNGKPGLNLSKGEKFQIAEEQLEKEGFSEGEAEELHELAEREGVGAQGAVELGGVAKAMGK